MSKKSLLASIFYATGLLSFMLWLNRLFFHRLIILAYHRVLDLGSTPEHEYVSDIELVSASRADFDWQVKFLNRHFSVTTFKDYASIANSGKKPGSIAIITFDDGFRDNYENAFPILKKNDVPAVFFISTDYIGSEIPFWFEYLVSVIKQVSNEELDEIKKIISANENSADRNIFSELALGYLKGVSNEKRLNTISSISRYCRDNQITIDNSAAKAMSWDNAREMSANGMEIGSHTVTHPILTNLPSESIRTEVKDSKRIIETELGVSCCSFSYPNGGVGDINQVVEGVVQECGYYYACSYIPGVNNHGRLSLFTLNRLHVERYVGRADFAAMLAMPWLFGK